MSKSPVETVDAKREVDDRHVRDCRITVLQALGQRTSNRVPWYKPIGVEAATTAVAGLSNSEVSVPRDVLKAMNLPVTLSWGKFAAFLGSSIPNTAEQRQTN